MWLWAKQTNRSVPASEWHEFISSFTWFNMGNVRYVWHTQTSTSSSLWPSHCPRCLKPTSLNPSCSRSRYLCPENTVKQMFRWVTHLHQTRPSPLSSLLTLPPLVCFTVSPSSSIMVVNKSWLPFSSRPTHDRTKPAIYRPSSLFDHRRSCNYFLNPLGTTSVFSSHWPLILSVTSVNCLFIEATNEISLFLMCVG